MRKIHTFLQIQNKLHWHIYRLLHGPTVSEKLPKIPLFGPSLIHQLQLLGFQQHPQSGAFLSSFSTWGTENSLAEINLESIGDDKGLYHFLGSKTGKNLQPCGRAHYRATRKNLERRTQLDEPAECASRGDPLLLYNILNLLFSALVRIICALRIESRKNYQHDLDGISISSAVGMPHQPFRILSLCFGVIGKTPGLISRNNFVKKNLSASAIAIMSWQDVTRSFLCSGVKERGENVHRPFYFPNPIIPDATRWSFLTKSATEAMFTSVRVDF
jgi:hypothetical protein